MMDHVQFTEATFVLRLTGWSCQWYLRERNDAHDLKIYVVGHLDPL